jgi:hypothetical protein
MVIITALIPGTPDQNVSFVGFRGTRPSMLIDWLSNLSIFGNFERYGIKGLRHSGYAELGNTVVLFMMPLVKR